ncbi:MAG: hypothetical protein O2800_01795 [Planctomycetota bacterium]|nr:hypothetical protein [Planctomycetota bacterium]
MKSRWFVLVCIVMVSIMIIVLPSHGQSNESASVAQDRMVTSSGSQLWIVQGESDGTATIRHVPSGRNPGAMRVVRPLPRMPEWIAASGDRLWMVIHDESSKSVVISMTAYAPLNASGLQEPRFGEIEPLTTLAASDTAIGLGADDRGPVLFLSPDSRLVRGVPLALKTMDGGDRAVDHVGSRIAPWWDGTTASWSIAWAQDGSLLMSIPSAGSFLRQQWSEVGDWNSIAGSHLPAVWKQTTSGAEVRSLRENATALVGRFPLDVTIDTVVFLEGGTGGLIGFDSRSPAMWRMDPVTGQTESIVVDVQTSAPPSLIWWQLPFIGAVTVGAILALILLRPGRDGVLPTMLPEGWEPLPLASRAAAFVVDGLPILAILVFISPEVPYGYWGALPGWSSDPERLPMGLLLVASLTLSSVLQEGLTGTSIGKRLVGAGIVTIASSVEARKTMQTIRPSRMRTAFRPLLRAVVLVAPAIVFLTLIDPSGCGLPEVISRTAVARRKRIMK